MSTDGRFLRLQVCSTEGTPLVTISVTDVNVMGDPNNQIWRSALLLLKMELAEFDRESWSPPEVK